MLKNEANALKNEINLNNQKGDVTKTKAKTIIEQNGVTDDTLLKIAELLINVNNNFDIDEFKKEIYQYIDDKFEALNHNALSDFGFVEEEFRGILKKENIKHEHLNKIFNRETSASWWNDNYPETLSYISNTGGIVRNLTSTKSKKERVIVSPSKQQMTVLSSFSSKEDSSDMMNEISEFIVLLSEFTEIEALNAFKQILTCAKEGTLNNEHKYEGKGTFEWMNSNWKDLLNFLLEIKILKNGYFFESLLLNINTKKTLILLNEINGKIEQFQNEKEI